MLLLGMPFESSFLVFKDISRLRNIKFILIFFSGTGDGFFSSRFQSTLQGNNLHQATLPKGLSFEPLFFCVAIILGISFVEMSITCHFCLTVFPIAAGFFLLTWGVGQSTLPSQMLLYTYLHVFFLPLCKHTFTLLLKCVVMLFCI